MSERLTLVVFKDHLSSRTLTVRLAWLRAFGLALLSVIGLAVVAAALFLNAYRKTLTVSSVANSMRVEELEKELAESKSAYEAIKNQALSGAAGGAVLAGAGHSFALLPSESVLEKLPAPETLPFRLEAIKAQWKGSTLQIRSAIEYARDDGGNQQGHFVIFVRGPQSLHAYPDGAFESSGAPTLIKPDGGEFFSVSRYREIKADFGPFAKRDDVQSIEIFIFDLKKRLIYLNRMGLESKAADAKAPPADDAKEKKPEAAEPAPKPKKAAPPKPAAAPATASAVADPSAPAAPATAAPAETESSAPPPAAEESP